MRRITLIATGFAALTVLTATVVQVTHLAEAAEVTYEAEAAANTLAGGARVGGCGPCSGGQRVGFVGNNGGTLQINGVNASKAGNATIAIVYTNGGAARAAQLSVNGGSATTVNFPGSGRWDKPGTVSITVNLKAGSNTLKFSNASGWAPDFDKIIVGSGSASQPGQAGPSASELLAKVSGCKQISTGKYRTDMETSATVPVCGKNGIVHWTADMDIDCDGQRTAQCNEQTDPWFQPSTHWQQSDGKHLNSATLPYVVVPSSSGIWDFTKHNIDGAGVCAIIYNNRVLYAVVGDSGPNQIIGEASYDAAKRLGIDPNPRTGGTDGPVTYIFFQGSKVSPIEDHGKATSVGEKLARDFINKN